MLDPDHCRARQRRLLDVMARRRLDAAVVSAPHHVYYLTGHWNFWLQLSALVLYADGRSWLVTANEPARAAAADDLATYEANPLGTHRQEQPDMVAALIAERLAGPPTTRHVGTDTSIVAGPLAARLGSLSFVDEDLWQLRRRKDADELALMRRAIDCTKAMYGRAREVIEPGVPELRVFTELHAAAVRAAGEPLAPMHLGNDFQCGSPGGPPRDGRAARAGELYILDLGPAYRGYFADNSRAFAVDRKPTDAQQRAWETVTGAFPIVERMARPGARCRDLFAAVDEHYRAALGAGFPHHLGHGVGLQPHEFPHLSPEWDDTLLEGEVFTCEPGLYGPDLGGGMRIENQYLVTEGGIENLTPFPLELA